MNVISDTANQKTPEKNEYWEFQIGQYWTAKLDKDIDRYTGSVGSRDNDKKTGKQTDCKGDH